MFKVRLDRFVRAKIVTKQTYHTYTKSQTAKKGEQNTIIFSLFSMRKLV